jgi:hypothetical protein
LKYDFFNNTVLNDKDELLLPPINLTGVGTPVMTFDVAYLLKTAGSLDKLELMVSNDCGATWTSMWSAAGASLATNPVPDPSVYNNPWDVDWTTFTVNLTGFNQPNVLAKFVTTNQNGNNLYLDNINLASSSIPSGLVKNNVNQLNLSVYPNPNTGMTHVIINSDKNQLAKLTVMNAIGQVVIEKLLDLSTGNNNASVDLSAYTSGIYLVNLEADNFKTNTKISVSK